MNMQPKPYTQEKPTTQPTSQRWLYLGTLRQESLRALLARQELPDQADFIMPEMPKDAWHDVLEVLPQAQQRTAKLAQHAGEQPYYRYNLPEFNATQRATGLYSLYPGLVLEDDSLIRLEPLQSLVDELAKQPVHTLVIEQPELALPLLKGLAQAHALASLRSLWLRTGLECPYENTPKQAELLAWCEQHGFEFTQRLADDPDFPLLQLQRHPLYDALQLEQARNAELAQECAALEDEGQTLRKQAEAQAIALDKLQAQLAEQASSSVILEQDNDALSEEIARLKKCRNELQQQVEKYQKVLEQATEEKQQLSKQLDEQNNSIQEAEKSKTQLENEKNKLQAELESSRELLDSQQKTAEEDQHQLKRLENRLSELNEARQQAGRLKIENQQLIQRQHAIQDKLVKAEAQLDLIKGPLMPLEPASVPRFQLHKTLNLGEAWAGNTINTVIFRHHGIMTVGEYQYTAFYVDEYTLRLVQRNLQDDTLQVHDVAGEYNLKDAHNSISLGMDREGHLHISYDHHATQLKYRRSQQPHDIREWTDELPMTGQNEERVTYPTFILPRQGFPLTLLYRHGTHNNGTALIKTYDEARRQWQDHPKPILSGADQKPWTANAYWNNPVVGDDGSLHLSFVWRTHPLGEEKRVNNINVGYAKSYDNGLTWWTSNHQPYQLPITPANAETVWPVSPGSNLMNQCSMALDSQQQPHIVFYSNHPSTGVPTYQHLWCDGIEWHHQYLAQASQPFNLQGGGTLQIPISRPCVLIDRQDNAHIIYRDHSQGSTFYVVTLMAPEYRYDRGEVHPLCTDIGFSEPIIDRERWVKNQLLVMLKQFTKQPNHDEFLAADSESHISEITFCEYFFLSIE